MFTIQLSRPKSRAASGGMRVWSLRKSERKMSISGDWIVNNCLCLTPWMVNTPNFWMLKTEILIIFCLATFSYLLVFHRPRVCWSFTRSLTEETRIACDGGRSNSKPPRCGCCGMAPLPCRYHAAVMLRDVM